MTRVGVAATFGLFFHFTYIFISLLFFAQIKLFQPELVQNVIKIFVVNESSFDT